MRFQRLLVPVDFGPAAEHAVDLAIAIAAAFEGRVELIHAFHLPPTAYMGEVPFVPFPIDEVRRAERDALDATLARARKRFPGTEATWVEGEPRERIVELAKERDVDLIVMGTHGHRRLARLFFGSVAERVVRTSTVPVLTTGAMAQPDGPASFRNILVPTDFGEPAREALDVASQLAKRFEAKLTLLHAYGVPFTLYDEQAYWPVADMAREAERTLKPELIRARKLYDRAESVLVQGDPRESILAVVAERGIDLVVMGTHRRSGLSRVFLGSVAERVVRTSSVPVFTTGADGGVPS